MIKPETAKLNETRFTSLARRPIQRTDSRLANFHRNHESLSELIEVDTHSSVLGTSNLENLLPSAPLQTFTLDFDMLSRFYMPFF